MESRRMRSRNQILKWVCYAVALFVCAALQTTPGLLQLGQAKPLFILPLCLAVAVYEGEFAGALFGAVSGLLWDYTAGRTVGMLALELLLLCFALSVLVQVYLQGSTWNFALISTGTALVVLSLDWLFFYYMPGYSWALSRWLTFVLPSAMMTLVPSLMLFSLVRHIYSAFKIDNGVVRTAGGNADEPKRTKNRCAPDDPAHCSGMCYHGPVRDAADLSAAGQRRRLQGQGHQYHRL